MADESGLSRNRRYIVWDTEKASLNKLQTTTCSCMCRNCLFSLYCYRSLPSTCIFYLRPTTIKKESRKFPKKPVDSKRQFLSSAWSLRGLGESPVPTSNIVTSPSTFFLVFRCLVYQKDGICRLVAECESVPSFADLYSICLYIL
jgi:hypothetical protein